MSSADLGVAVHKAIAATLDHIGNAADAIAMEFHLTNSVVLGMIAGGVAGQLRNETPAETDARTAKWRCRFRIYDAQRLDEPVADSDEDRQADMPGTTILAGLPAVAAEVIALAGAFHGTLALSGLSSTELRHKLKSLRPTLSRAKASGGVCKAVWRVHYDTIDTYKTSPEAKTRGWLMRVDIVREITQETE